MSHLDLHCLQKYMYWSTRINFSHDIAYISSEILPINHSSSSIIKTKEHKPYHLLHNSGQDLFFPCFNNHMKFFMTIYVLQISLLCHSNVLYIFSAQHAK